MTLYLGATALSMLFAKASVRTWDIRPNRPSLLFAVLSFLPLSIVSALRYRLGTDWYIYEHYFFSINRGGEKFSEVGFNLLNAGVYFLTHNYCVFSAIIAVLIGIFVYLALYDHSVDIPVSILMFVLAGNYFNSMNQLRQVLAMAIFLYALKYLFARKPWSYFLWIAVAASCHMVALLYIPLYFLYGRKVNGKIMGAIFAGCVLLQPLLGKLFTFFVSLTKYNWYLDSAYAMNNFYLRGFVCALLMLATYILYYYVGKDKDDHAYNLYVNMQFIAVLLLLFSSAIPQVLRVCNSLLIVTCLVVSKVLKREENPKRRFALFAFIVLLFGGNLIYEVYFDHFWYGVTPYDWVFAN